MNDADREKKEAQTERDWNRMAEFNLMKEWLIDPEAKYVISIGRSGCLTGDCHSLELELCIRRADVNLVFTLINQTLHALIASSITTSIPQQWQIVMAPNDMTVTDAYLTWLWSQSEGYCSALFHIWLIAKAYRKNKLWNKLRQSQKQEP